MRIRTAILRQRAETFWKLLKKGKYLWRKTNCVSQITPCPSSRLHPRVHYLPTVVDWLGFRVTCRAEPWLGELSTLLSHVSPSATPAGSTPWMKLEADSARDERKRYLNLGLVRKLGWQIRGRWWWPLSVPIEDSHASEPIASVWIWYRTRRLKSTVSKESELSFSGRVSSPKYESFAETVKFRESM